MSIFPFDNISTFFVEPLNQNAGVYPLSLIDVPESVKTHSKFATVYVSSSNRNLTFSKK